jgi:hypothetical protein
MQQTYNKKSLNVQAKGLCEKSSFEANVKLDFSLFL